MSHFRPPYPYGHDKQFAYSRGWQTVPHSRRFTLEELRIGRPATPPDSMRQALKEIEDDANRPHLHRAQYFRKWHYGEYLPMAIVAHPFSPEFEGWMHHESSLPFESHAAWAATHGLIATRLPHSWLNVVGIGVMYMRPHTEIEDAEYR
ncbi:hypothetical protein [Pseudoxanthomonas koreensis]|uniref:hypothetical protein n=1 Tax=Pseudoxanthomonas koreensis TaxID=266061 RepID=UPI0013910F38|nr:hypothetical protein [Pseudoxanthomonas koreensis]